MNMNSGMNSSSMNSNMSSTNANMMMSAPNADDETILGEVEDVIERDQYLAVPLLFAQIRVKNGRVTISGTLPSEDLKERAERLIYTVPGVKSLESNIIVVP